MKLFLHITSLILISILIGLSALGQEEIVEYTPVDEEICPITSCFPYFETKPEFPGGQIALLNFIANHTKYPKEAWRDGIQGTVYVKFDISTKGKIENIEIVKGVCDALDKECIRVISSMPDWEPATARYRPEKYCLIQPIHFVLYPEDKTSTQGNDSINSPTKEKRTESPFQKKDLLGRDSSETKFINDEGFESINLECEAFPNPTSNVITIRHNLSSEQVRLYVYNSLGKIILQSKLTQAETDITLSGCPAGMYIFKLSTNNQNKMIKVLKQ